MSISIDLIFAEFGAERKNAGDSQLHCARLDPAYSSFLKYLPQAQVKVYTDQDWQAEFSQSAANVTLKRVQPPFDRKHSRYGNRCNDYYKLAALLASTADVVIATDADILCVSDGIHGMVEMALKFGLLAPANGRLLVKHDARSTCDGSPVNDPSRGMGFAYNGTPYVYGRRNEAHTALIQAYLDEMRQRPCRGPVAMWRAVWKTGTYPYLLPFQFCLCQRHVDLEDPCLAHVGHEVIRQKFMS
jgi:hypothetical protein